MIVASALFALAGLGLLALSLVPGSPVSVLLPLSTLAMAGVLYGSRGVATFARLLIGIVAGAHALLAALNLAARYDLLPAGLGAFTPPLSMPVAASVFGAVLLAVARIPVVRQITHLADPYFDAREPGTIRIWPLPAFRAQERWIAIGLTTIVVALQFSVVAITVRLSYWNREWFDAIQNRNADEFWRLLLMVWVPWIFVAVSISILRYAIQQTLIIRWRAWLTQSFTQRWLSGSTHYRMQLFGGQTDNPDQRIQEDVRKFTATTLSLTIGILSQVSTLVSFSVILWTISADFTLPGTTVVIPGLMFWIALVYAVVATYFTHIIGRPLIRLNFLQERYEADFRFSLARLREYGEQVSLMRGEGVERQRLGGQFGRVIDNFFKQVSINKRLIAFTSFYDYSNSVVPYIIAAPFYFTGKITLGVMTQTAGAFARVENALSYFINTYETLADYKAVLDRLTSFEGAMGRAGAAAEVGGIARVEHEGRDLRLEGLSVRRPEGAEIVRADGTVFPAGQATLLVGPSGTGKSTLFRAISGIWPFGGGRVLLPRGASLMLLPQRPYIPVGTLRGAVTYPSSEEIYTDEQIREALTLARLPQLVDELDQDRGWALTLSIGEQQRLAVARALLARPDWLLLDEATAAMDETTEAALYRLLRERLPNTTIVSIGHRSTLQAFHDVRIEMRPVADGIFAPERVREPAAAE